MKFDEFFQIYLGHKMASPKLSYHSPEIQDGDSKTENAWKMVKSGHF
jgi:hypothetical protein